MTDRNLRLLPLVLAAVGSSWSLLVAGDAQASVWTGHATHFAPPSDAHWASSSPMRARVVTSPHAVSFVSPRPTWAGSVPMRAQHGMASHFVAPRPVLSTTVPFRAEPGSLASVGPRPAMTRAEREHPGTTRFVYIAQGSRAGASGFAREHASTRSPTTSAVRWPVGSGAHPIAPGVIPPSQRAAATAPHPAGRR
jgi:hypothetical protein